MNLDEKQLQQFIAMKNSPGYELLLEMVAAEIGNLSSPKNISRDKPYQDIAIECLGKSYASEIIEKIFDKIDSLKIITPIKREPMI